MSFPSRLTPVLGARRFFVPGLPKWSAAVNAARAGQRNARLLCLGDSTTFGQGALSTAITGNDKSASWPTVLAAKSFGGVPGRWDNTIGTGNITASTYGSFDNRLTMGSGVGQGGAGSESLGGTPFARTSAGNFFVWTPGVPVDTFEIYYCQQSGGGIFSFAVDGGAATQVNTNGSTAVLKTTVSVARGNHSLSLDHVSGAKSFVYSVIAYDSAQKSVQVLNAGWPGVKATDYAVSASPFSPLNVFDDYAPDLTVLDLGINDWNQATPTTQTAYKAAMQALISAAKAVGSDVLLVVPVPSGTTSGTANQASFQTYIYDLAASNGLPVVDMIARWGSWASANSAGLMRDTLHPNSTGYADKAAAIAAAIIR